MQEMGLEQEGQTKVSHIIFFKTFYHFQSDGFGKRLPLKENLEPCSPHSALSASHWALHFHSASELLLLL